jgi:pimeloyl-ACP methyl ester carboxylesterase
MPYLERDGGRLAYEEAGTGEQEFLFVHGWMCERSHFAPQMEHFSAAARCVTVDLRGHGDSEKPDQGYPMAAFADDLRWMCQRLALQKPIVVGHSMGGVVAVTLAAAEPQLVKSIVALDCPISMSPGHHAALQRVAQRFHGPDYVEQVRRFVSNMFLPIDDQRRKARIIETMLAGPQHVGMSAFDEFLASPISLADTMPNIEAPLLAIASGGGHMASLDRLGDQVPMLVTGQAVGAGHFLQLEVPDQVNSMIERFLRIIEQGKPSTA